MFSVFKIEIAIIDSIEIGLQKSQNFTEQKLRVVQLSNAILVKKQKHEYWGSFWEKVP
jgi:hypothetical protein